MWEEWGACDGRGLESNSLMALELGERAKPALAAALILELEDFLATARGLGGWAACSSVVHLVWERYLLLARVSTFPSPWLQL